MLTTIEIKIDENDGLSTKLNELCEDIEFYPGSNKYNKVFFQTENECTGIYDRTNERAMVLLAFEKIVNTDKKKKVTTFICHYLDLEDCSIQTFPIKVNDIYSNEFIELSKNYEVINHLNIVVS